MNACRNGLVEGISSSTISLRRLTALSSTLALIALCSSPAFAQQASIPATHGPWLSGVQGSLQACKSAAEFDDSAQALIDHWNQVDPAVEYTIDECVANWPDSSLGGGHFGSYCVPSPTVQGDTWPQCTVSGTSRSTGGLVTTTTIKPLRRVSCPAGQAFTSDPSHALTGEHRALCAV
jgi:hypothetical protein